MKFLTFVLLGNMMGVTLSEEMPSLERLSAESFQEREAGQAEMVDWVIANHEGAREKLLSGYFKAMSPETRARLLPLLERAYFKPKGYVGVVMSPVLERQFGRLPQNNGGGLNQRLPDDEIGRGVKITEVLPGTPAAASGLKLHDVIVKINDWEVRGGYDLTAKVADEIQRNPPHTPVALKVKRGEEFLEIKLKLGLLPIPSERFLEIQTAGAGVTRYIPPETQAQLAEFRGWLSAEIEKEKKNLIAERR